MTLLKLFEPAEPFVASDQGPFGFGYEEVFGIQASIERSFVRHKAALPVAATVVQMFSEAVRDLIVIGGLRNGLFDFRARQIFEARL
jgi:hypothetical protein